MSAAEAVKPIPPDSKCLCSICKCGNHNCPQQYHIDQTTSGGKIYDGRELGRVLFQDLPKINYYTSTYRQDFEVKAQSGLPDLCKLKNNLKCPDVPIEGPSVYCRDFVPLATGQRNPCSSKGVFGAYRDTPLHPELVSLSTRNPTAVDKLCRYYCPAHCVGSAKEEEVENCLAPFKDKFVIGPPPGRRVDGLTLERPLEPFTKHSSYTLDYVPHKAEPRKAKNRAEVPPSPQPRSLSTTYKTAFPWPEEAGPGQQNLTRAGAQASNVRIGDDSAPVVGESTHMVDFQPPRGATQRTTAVKPKSQFSPPNVKMESETTSGDAYRRWKVLPPRQVGPLSHKSNWGPVDDGDPRCRVTTYQEDFDGVCEALCPAKMIENHGPKILEPRFNFVGTNDGHDFYRQLAQTPQQ